MLKKIIFHNFYVLFPDWYIHETIYNLIFISFMFFPDWYIHETFIACNEELRRPGVKGTKLLERFERTL